jgi:replicative DNA helicase
MKYEMDMSFLDEVFKRESEYDATGVERLKDVMREYQGEDKLYTSQEIVEALKDAPKEEGMNTGIKRLDELTGGFRKKQVISIFAHSGHGKTEFSTYLMSLFPEEKPVLIPLEQNAEELVSQRLERGYSIPYFLAPRHHDAFVSTKWIEDRVIEGIAKYNTGMVVIDHLGYIDTNGEDGKWRKENLAFRIGQTMKEINHIGEKWNVVVILLVHVSEGDEGKPPQLTDIGNSSDIKKESDTVIGVWRKNSLKKKVRVYDPENKTMLAVLKSRRMGKIGSVGLRFNSATGEYIADQDWIDSMENAAQVAVQEDDMFDV